MSRIDDMLHGHRGENLSRGFTLIELLVVIAIISMLSSVILASLNGARLKARDVRRVADIRQLQLALALYYDDNRRYPDALSDLWSGGTTYLPAAVLPPVSGIQANYAYAVYGSSGARTYYHLGAVLESTATNDRDCRSDSSGTSPCQSGATASGGFNGVQRATCSAGSNGAADFCYDVTP